ncbi:MAG: phage portal protein [Verrucomicrobiales bacterium]|jgi:SPP1 gp7 family putative phage head morphogenesis protein|nr:phage portal protein [Verrucomicrobiales bacterium]
MNLHLKIGAFSVSIGKSAGGGFAQVGGAAAGTKLTRPLRSAWVLRAIKTVTEPIVSVPVQFFTVSGDREQPVNNQMLADFWAAPFAGLSFEDGIEALVGWLKLRGECFLVMDDSWLARGVRSKLLIARPDHMREVKRGGELLGWQYNNNGRALTLLPEQVASVKFWNPDDAWRGLGEYQAAQLAAESDYAAAEFSKTLAENNGDRGPYIVSKVPLNEEQVQQAIMQIQDKRRLAQRGIFQPYFLTNDFDVRDPQIQAVDAAFVAQRAENRHEIFVAFGVPASMADVTASYSVGSASDRYRLIEDTCIPTARKLSAAIEQVSARLTGDASIRARFNFDEHSVMQQVRGERIDSALKLWGMGVPLAEADRLLKLGLNDFPGKTTGYLPFSVAPVGAMLDADGDEFAEPKADDEVTVGDDLAKILAKFQISNSKLQVNSNLQAPNSKQAASAAPRLCAHCSLTLTDQAAPRWRQHAAARLKTAKMYRSKIGKVLFDARKEMLAKLNALDELSGIGKIENNQLSIINQKAGVASTLMFNLAKFAGAFRDVMEAAGRNAFDTAGAEAWAEFGKNAGGDNPWQSPPQAVRDFLAARENRLEKVPDEVFEQVRGALQASVESGASIDEMAKAIRGAFDEVGAGRARAIAMTETSAAYGAARQASMKQAGIQWKQWLTSGNDNVRAAHAAADGQTVPVDEPFVVDGEELMHPGDSNGSPENVINCHCVSIAVDKGPEADL